MSEGSKESVVSTLMGGSAPTSGLHRLVKAFAIAVPVIGATPTAYNLYQSYQNGIPYSEVSYRLAQHDLWVKNFDCKFEYKALTTTHGSRVDVGACPKTGDISIKVTAQNGEASYEWLAYDKLKRPAKAASFMDLVVPPAEAGEASAAVVGSPASFRMAQAGMEVVCQSMVGKQIVRVVRDAGKCYREQLSPFAGKVERREEVPCTTTCK